MFGIREKVDRLNGRGGISVFSEDLQIAGKRFRIAGDVDDLLWSVRDHGFGEGFAEGISGSARTVERAVDTMLNATTKRPIMAVGGYSVSPVTGTRTGTGGGASGDSADMVNVTLVLDEEVLGSVMAPIVNDKIGAKIQATRR